MSDDLPSADSHWVALIKRGGCTFSTKMNNVPGASAVIVYNDVWNDQVQHIAMNHGK